MSTYVPNKNFKYAQALDILSQYMTVHITFKNSNAWWLGRNKAYAEMKSRGYIWYKSTSKYYGYWSKQSKRGFIPRLMQYSITDETYTRNEHIMTIYTNNGSPIWITKVNEHDLYPITINYRYKNEINDRETIGYPLSMIYADGSINEIFDAILHVNPNVKFIDDKYKLEKGYVKVTGDQWINHKRLYINEENKKDNRMYYYPAGKPEWSNKYAIDVSKLYKAMRSIYEKEWYND